jgi:putative nucleotidyltransferase with HDIG domain
MPEYRVRIDQLRIGVFIRLEAKWFAHPFLSNSFKITKSSIIDALREMGLETVICDPEKCDVLPYPAYKEQEGESPDNDSAGESEETKRLWELKKEKIDQLKKIRENLAQCEKRFNAGIKTIRNVMQNIHSGSADSVEGADQMLCDLIDSLMDDEESAIQLMNTESGNQNVFYHSLNVSVLSLILGREYGLEREALRVLGLGALFHDVGKSKVPKSIVFKKDPTPAELKFLQLHPAYGEAILNKIPIFPEECKDIVLHHHERFDGQGYPDRLSGKKLTVQARIVSIANVYDNYCNQPEPKDSLTPYEALSRMFALEKEAFDKELLALFIQCLGVYAPGTIVQLSNGSVGMVISVTRNFPLKPNIIIYDPHIPKSEALIIDMREDPALSISHSIRPMNLDSEIFEYLSPRTRVTYYIADSDSLTGGGIEGKKGKK